MEKKLFVGNLPYTVTDEQLAEIFVEAGFSSLVSAVVITDRNTGRSKGFGFVEMATEEDAAGAMEALNGKDIDGRALVVNEARPRQE